MDYSAQLKRVRSSCICTALFVACSMALYATAYATTSSNTAVTSANTGTSSNELQDPPPSDQLINFGQPLSNFGKSAADKGIYFSFLNISELFHQASGGNRYGNPTRTRKGGQTDLSTIFDLNRLFGLSHAGTVKFTVDYQYGTLAQFVSENTGASLMGSGIQGPGIGLENTYRITELSYSNFAFGKKLWYLVGRTQATFFFNLEPYTLGFENTNIDVGSLPQVLDTDFVFYPEATWGGVAQYNASKNVYFRMGAYENNSNAANRSRHDVELSFKNSTGVFVPAQLGWSAKMGGLPGSYDVGAYYSSTNVALPIADSEQSNRGHTGIWLHGIQKVWRPNDDPSRGVRVFAGASWATSGRHNFIKNEYDVGALWSGPFAARPHDQLAVLATDTTFGDAVVQFRNARFASQRGLSSHNYQYEIYYSLDLGSGIFLKPFVQRWVHPDQIFTAPFDGGEVIPASTVVGINLTVNFNEMLGLPFFHLVVPRP